MVDSPGPAQPPEKRKVGGSTPPLTTTLTRQDAWWSSCIERSQGRSVSFTEQKNEFSRSAMSRRLRRPWRLRVLDRWPRHGWVPGLAGDVRRPDASVSWPGLTRACRAEQRAAMPHLIFRKRRSPGGTRRPARSAARHMLNALRIDGAVAALPIRLEMPSISSIERSNE
jgi:hypothetical protein